MPQFNFLISLRIFISIAALVLTSCATKPRGSQVCSEGSESYGVNQGQSWSAKMQVEKLSTQKKQRVNLEVLGRDPESLRVDVTGTFGVVGGVGALDRGQMTLLLPRQKKAYQGMVSEKSLLPILNVALDPRILLPVFQGRPIPNWECNDSHQLKECKLPPYRVETTEKTLEQRKIQIEGPDFVALLVIQDPATKVQAEDKDFRLEIPEGYSSYKLQ